MANVILLLLALVPLISGFSCDVELSQARLLAKYDGSSLYQLSINNPSPFLVRSALLVPASPLISVQSMNMNEEGLVFPTDYEGMPPHKSYLFNYTAAGLVNIMVKWANCDVYKGPNVTLPIKHHNHHPKPAQAERSAHEEDDAREHSEHKPEHPTGTPRPSPTHTPHNPSTTAPATSAPSHPSTVSPAHPVTPAPSTSAPTETPSNPATAAPSTPAPSTSAPTPAVEVASTGASSGVCSGVPRMLNGKPCASTTRYWDDQKGACGCGTTNAFPWIGTQYTAAASPPLFGTATWCGTGCGKCYNLTTTGYSPDGKGAASGESIVIMVTNLCPPGGAWCAAGLNSFNYGAHFDLADLNMNGIITQLGWDNPEVVYEEVACTGEVNSPTTAEYETCQCASL